MSRTDVRIVDLTDEHMHFVASCTHVDKLDEETEKVVAVREAWLRKALAKGLRMKVAVEGGTPLGFAHCLPIELETWGMSGKDLMTVPCLTLKYDRVYREERGSGLGRALMKSVEQEAKKSKKGVAVLAYAHDFWFMPASFFSRLRYEEVLREGDTVIMLKAFAPVEPPFMHRPQYRPSPVEGKVTVEAFWNPICATSIAEIHRVRDVCSEFGEEVILKEFNTGDKGILDTYQISRALFIDGASRCWGYAAPRDELRTVIEQALEEKRRGRSRT
ncbi:MAG: GNAT family N-acetyltransferase [Candidatus Eiseniibacteriota bacterium]|nr:MAG: GNAT family N-acetyltransferase [Candidatus Eisenbacteria bacterium]